ncbi:MAG TPA: PrgI family protein [Candidatus Saccharimonadales bacterium]
MSVYKVPQDVEAEDKLLGPFSFRQFVYLIIAAGCGFITFLLVQAPLPVPFFSIPLILIALGFIIIALPLRKDQPMELYVLALLRFYLKPKRRMWQPDGTTTGVIIDAPHVIHQQLTKDLTEEEAATRLSYLAQIIDTRGWAAKGVTMPTAANSSVKLTVADEAGTVEDVLDENTSLARSLDSLIAKQKEASRTVAVEKMRTTKQAPPQLSPAPQPTNTAMQPQFATAADDSTFKNVHYNPYPTMHQQVIDPHGHQPAPQKQAEEQKPTMTPPVSPDIMRLANNNDLSIEAIAHEAHRLQESNDEVVVSLR